MQRLEVSGAVRLIYRSLGVKGLRILKCDVVMGFRRAFRFCEDDVRKFVWYWALLEI